MSSIAAYSQAGSYDAPKRNKPANKLWQRVFLHILLLVVVSQLAVLTLFLLTQDMEYRQKWLEDYVGSLGKTMSEQDLQAAEIFLRHINRHDPRMWLEKSDGSLLLGTARQGFGAKERAGLAKFKEQRGNVTIIDIKQEGRTTFCSIPVRFTQEDALLCYVFPGYEYSTPIQDIFYQGLLALLIVGGIMSFWAARSIARPLNAFREETLEMAGGRLDRRVSVRGYDEINDLAVAVNSLTENLVRHIDGAHTLLANVSHELRSPVTRMEFYHAMLDESAGGLIRQNARLAALCGQAEEECFAKSGAEKINLNLKNLKEEISYLEWVIGSNLLLSRLSLQSDRSDFEDVNFSDLCAEMLRRYAPIFERNGLRLMQSIGPDLQLRGQEELLCHMLSNILDNCVKYAEPKGEVSLRLAVSPAREGIGKDAETAASLVTLTIANHCAQLDPNHTSNLFEPFYRGGRATGGGAGLGLALVRQIAVLHNGTVTAACAHGEFILSVTLPRGSERSGSAPKR